MKRVAHQRFSVTNNTKKVSKKILCIAALLAALSAGAQHNDLYSHYMFNGFAINPAYAGSNDVLTLVLLHRHQWTGFDGAPRTTTFSAHTPLKNKKVNMGLSFISDQYGITNRNKFNIAYAYRVSFNKGALFMGLQGGVNFIRNPWSQLILTNPGDKAFIGQEELTSVPEAGFGIYYKSEKFYIGASSPALFAAEEPGTVLRPSFLQCGYVFFLPNDIRMKHSLLVKYMPNSPIQFDFNTNLYYKSIGAGFSYRTGAAMIFLLEYKINEQFNVGYSYDLSVNRLGAYNNGTHEILLRYQFGYGVTAPNPRYF
jgi:type IX secretion system PorP/SprF family membrane protein